MRILQVGPTLYQGGVAVAIAQLTSALSKLGHQLMLVGNGGEVVEGLPPDVNYRFANWSQKPLEILKSSLVVRKAIKDFRPDIVHVHGRGAALACSLAGRKADWFTLHNTTLTRRISVFDAGPVRKYFSPLGRRMFVLNSAAANYVHESLCFQRDHIRIVANGVDCKRFRASSKQERSDARAYFAAHGPDLLAVFIGRFDPQKQPDAIIKLAVAARAEQLAVKFVMVGAGELEDSLRAQIEENGLQQTCQIYPWMDPLGAYWAADIVLMPSLFEGFSLVAAEALACGSPLLMTRTGGYAEVIREGVTGFDCAPDPDSFVAEGLQVLRRRDDLANMRTGSRAWAEKHLSIEEQARKTVLAYKEFFGE